MNKSKPYITDIAIRSFRDVADQDYIAARACYKNGLIIQFLWMAQQAIEKYLKSILLFNDKSTKKLSHKLNKALSRISTINYIELDLTEDVIEFIKYLDNHGVNRYLEKALFTKGMELLIFDKAVWQLRRYCKVINHNNEKLLKFKLDEIHEWRDSKSPYKFKITGGHLEKVIKNNNHIQRENLVWANGYYGKRNKNKVTIPNNFNFINPTHILYPEHFDELSKLIHFPAEVAEYIQELQVTNG